MSTIARERLEQLANFRGAPVTRQEEQELARIALASLEAEAVAYMHRSGQVVTREECCDDKMFAICCKVETPLFTAPPVPVSVPETLPCPVFLEPGMRFGKGVRTQTMLDALQRRSEYFAELEAMTTEQRTERDAGIKEFAAMLQGAEPVTTAYKLPATKPCKEAPEHIWLQTAGVWPENGEFSELTWCSDNQHQDDTLYVRADVVAGNSPVIPDGYALVPIEPTDEMWRAALDATGVIDSYKAMIEAAPQREV